VVPEWAEPGIINQALLKITLNSEVVAQSYFVYLFRFLSSRLSARGTGMQNLAGVKELKKVLFRMPLT
jgi:type I restriction enzyme S subunit